MKSPREVNKSSETSHPQGLYLSRGVFDMQSKRSKARGQRKGRKKTSMSSRFVQLEKGVKDVQRMKIWRDIPPPIPRMPKGPSQGALMSCRQMVIGAFTQNTNVTNGTGGNYILQTGSTPLLGQISFCIADLAQVTTFSSMFDRFRIDKVKLRISSRNPAASPFNVASPNNAVPQIYLAVDRDDSSAPSTLDELTQYDNSIVIPGTCSLDVDLIPSVVSTIANASSAATSSVIRRSDELWLDIAATTIPHFGIKFGVSPLQATSTSNWYFDIQAWYVVSFKNVR